MTHVLAEMDFDGVVLMNVPMIFPKVIDQFRTAFGGYLNWAMGTELKKTIMPHM
jgi:hypothetical protein